MVAEALNKTTEAEAMIAEIKNGFASAEQTFLSCQEKLSRLSAMRHG